MRTNGNQKKGDKAANSRPVAPGLPSSLRINPAVLAAVLPAAVEMHAATTQDPAHLRRYMELQRRMAIGLRADAAAAA